MNESEKALLLFSLLLLKRQNEHSNKNIKVSFSYLKNLFPNTIERSILLELWNLFEENLLQSFLAHRDEKITLLESPSQNTKDTSWQDMTVTLEIPRSPQLKKIKAKDYDLKTKKDLNSLASEISDAPSDFYLKFQINEEAISSKLKEAVNSWHNETLIVSTKSGKPKWQIEEVKEEITKLKEKYSDNRMVIEGGKEGIDLLFILLFFEYSGNIKIQEIVNPVLFKFEIPKKSQYFYSKENKNNHKYFDLHSDLENLGGVIARKEDIELDENIVLRYPPKGSGEKVTKKYSLLLHKLGNGLYRKKVPIKPYSAFIIYHLYKIKGTPFSELGIQDLANKYRNSKTNNKGAASNAIKTIEDLCQKEDLKSIICSTIEDRHTLNPKLDCCRSLNRSSRT